MRAVLLCAGLVACVAAPAAPTAVPDPSALLVEAARASRTTTFEGVMVYRGEKRFEVLRILHRYKKDSESERLISLTGERREVLRTDNRLICILPKGHALTAAGPAIKGFLSQLTPTRIRELEAWYDFRTEGEARIAGRPCDGVTIAPRDAYRYGYEVWTDRESRLPLKVTLTDGEGQMLEQVMFTEVSFPTAIPDSAFLPTVDQRKFDTFARELPRLDGPPKGLPVDEPAVNFEHLPPGFRVIARDQRKSPDGQSRVDHVLLSDGLSAVSVFSQISQHDESAFSGVSHMGPVQAYGRTVGSFHVTIVGEVPPQTIRMIGDNLRLPLPPTDGAAQGETATP